MAQDKLILLVEDNDDDVSLIERAFRKARIENRVVVVNDGDKAVAYLNGEGVYADRVAHPLPSLVLPDLKMPRRNGFEVLSWIRSQPRLKGLQVVILTGSLEKKDVSRASELGADSFLIKPVSFERLVAIVLAMKDYCLGPGNDAEGLPNPGGGPTG
jgi:CheY-like chemotaxis protein